MLTEAWRPRPRSREHFLAAALGTKAARPPVGPQAPLGPRRSMGMCTHRNHKITTTVSVLLLCYLPLTNDY